MIEPRVESAGLDRDDLGWRSSRIVPRANDVERHLRRWIDQLCDHPPLVDALTVDDLHTDCGRASLLRAALAQLISKRADVIEADLRRELGEADTLLLARMRLASYDLAGHDWAAAARRPSWGELQQRRAEGGRDE